MHSLAAPLAVALLALLPVIAVAGAFGAFWWGRWLVTVGGVIGMVGLAVTGIATVNLFVPRTCATFPLPGGAEVRDVNRPALSLVLDEGDCFEQALAQTELVLLAGVGASAAVLARQPIRLARPIKR